MAARKKENTAEIITETAEEQPVKAASAGSDMTFVAVGAELSAVCFPQQFCTGRSERYLYHDPVPVWI